MVRIRADGDGAATGIALASGEEIAAPLVLSSLPRRTTLSLVDPLGAVGLAAAAALARAASGTQMARVTLALDGEPVIAGSAVPRNARFVVAERLESLTAAHAAARTGLLPEELTMEVTIPSASDATLAPEGRHLLSALVGPLPRDIDGGWRKAKPLLAAKVVAALSHHFTGLAGRLVGADVLTPQDVRETYGAEDAFGGPVDVARLLAGWHARVETPVRGLLVCGAAADPVGSVSGRGGRMAACYAFEMERKK